MVLDRTALVIMMCALTVGISRAADLPLVPDGQAAAVIVVPAQPTPTEQFAAEELQRCIAESSGAAMPIVNDGEAIEGPFISVGRTHLAAGLDYARDDAFPDPYIIRSDGGGVLILGRGDRGTIYGVYDFLRRFVGCRWIMPGQRGEIIPARTDITIPETHIEETPAFRSRIAAGFRDPDYVDWAVKNRLHIWSPSPADWPDPEMEKRGGYLKGTMHHAFDSLLPEDEYFADHPEYYALLGGKRVPAQRAQLCVSNPDVVRIVSEAAIAYFDEHPEASFFSLCPNDNQNWCECEGCAAYDVETMERWGREYPIVSDRYFAFANRVADALAAKHPDKLLYTFAYQNYTWPPRKHLPRENMIVSLCHMVPACYSHRLTDPDCERNRQFNALLTDWTQVHGNMWYYAYTCKSMWEQMPWPIARRLADDIRRLHGSGFQGFYSQGSQGLWGQLGVNFRVMAPMLWNPDTDVEATLKEYFSLAFGPAGEAMSEFYDSLEAGFSAADVHVHHEVDIWGPEVLAPEVRERCDAVLERAQRLAADDEAVGERIAPMAAAYRYAVLRVEALAGEERWRNAGSEEGLKVATEAYRDIIALAEANPGGQALSLGSVRRYVLPRYDRLALPYDALFAAEGEGQYAWEALVPAASFEGDTPAGGWRLSEDQPDCGVELSRDRAHDGEASLRIWSAIEDEGSPRMTALTHDWVIVNTLSDRIPVEVGDGIVLTAWLFVPRDFQQTKRGATLGLVGYDAQGKSPRGWTAGSIETRRVETTDGWQRLIVARSIDSEAITRVAIRLAVSGLGEAYFDDVELRRGKPK